jgi:hypothetical protein
VFFWLVNDFTKKAHRAATMGSFDGLEAKMFYRGGISLTNSGVFFYEFRSFLYNVSFADEHLNFIADA